MRGIWLENRESVFRDDLDVPSPEATEVLIRTELAGVCSTDLELIQGYYPFTGILGHEFVGRVVEPGGFPHLVDKRVVGEINITCHQCVECKSLRSTHCENRRTLGIHDYNGVFADYFVLPAENLHIVPPNVDNRSAVFTEPLAAALEITSQCHISPNDRILIVGGGRLGLLVTQVLLMSGAEVTVVIRRTEHQPKIQRWGAKTIWAHEIQHRRYDIVVDTTGNKDGFRIARSAVRPRGTLVMKSTYAGDLTLNMSSIVVDEISIVGSRCGPFKPALNLLSQGKIETEPMISGTYLLNQGLTALEDAANPGVLKTLIQIDT